MLAAPVGFLTGAFFIVWMTDKPIMKTYVSVGA